MQANRPRDTKPELALRRAVHARGLRYYVNRRPVKAVRRTADLLFPRLRLAVFLDGCFWHGCPEHHTAAKTNAAFWAEKVETNRRRDAGTNDLLAQVGWTVVRVWEHEAADEAADRIVDAVATLRARPIVTR
jgi:DNA mismatch endonuclease (patch repair protein)